MKIILKRIINILLISYTFLMLDFGLHFFALYFLTFITSMLFTYYALIIVLPIMLTTNIFLANLILSIVAIIQLSKPYILKDNKTLILSYIIGLIIYLLIYNLFSFYDTNIVDLLVKGIFSLSLFLLIKMNLKLYTTKDNQRAVSIINTNLYHAILLLVCLFSIITNDLNLLFLVWLIVFTRSITNNLVFIATFSITLILVYVLMYNEYTITILALFLATYYYQKLPKVFFIVFILLYNNNYIKIFYLNKDYLLQLIGSILILWLFYKKEILRENKTIRNFKNSLNDYVNYIDLCVEELQQTSANKKLNKTIEDIFSTFCSRCTNSKVCNRKKMDVYNIIKVILTNKIDLNTLKQSKSISDFAYFCPKFQEFNKIEKVRLEKNYAYESMLESKKLITNLINNFNNKEDSDIFDRYINFLTSQGYNVINYSYISFDNLFELYMQIEGINKSIIENILVNYAQYYLKKECGYTILNKSLNNISFKIFYKPMIKLSFEQYALAKNNDRLLGDNFMAKKDILGRYVFALSDGMGSGYEAFSESSQMLRLVSKLTNLKLDIKTSVDLLDNFYAYKNDSDSFASLDFLQIDSVNKKASLFKLGSASTYLLSKNKLKILQNTNLPLGMSSTKDIYTFNLYKNDLIILVTDGVTEHVNLENLERHLISIVSKPISNIVYDIIDLITKQSHPKILDDVSVLAIKVA